jgi:hypothetical protein
VDSDLLNLCAEGDQTPCVTIQTETNNVLTHKNVPQDLELPHQCTRFTVPLSFAQLLLATFMVNFFSFSHISASEKVSVAPQIRTCVLDGAISNLDQVTAMLTDDFRDFP